MVNDTTQEKSNLIVPLVIVVALIPIIGLAWWYLSRPATAPGPPPLTSEAKIYVRSLKLSGVEMKATANYTGAAIVEITGNITNAGDRMLNRVELNCVFYDPYGQVVLRERVPIVKTPLKPGETAQFRMPFEGLPDSWNKAMPQLVIATIVFG